MSISIVLNTKKTIIVSSIGVCILGSIYAAYRVFINSRIKEKSAALPKGPKIKIRPGGKKTARPSSLKYNDKAVAKKARNTLSGSARTERDLLMATLAVEEAKNIPAEELLELGMNYLNQAIKSWETALDSIESAVYMQSQTLALPTDKHADLVYKLRNLVEGANNITVNLDQRVIKSSHTLQIIQSRLAYKQQMYAEALLRQKQANGEEDEETEQKEETANLATSPSSNFKDYYQSSSSRYNFLSDEDNESFVSADSDVDWLTDEMLKNIENIDEKNVLYEMAMSSANLGRIGYRVDRTNLLKCKSTQDFAAKLHVIRLGFDRLLQDKEKRNWFAAEGKKLAVSLFRRAEKDASNFLKTYDEMVRFCSVESNWVDIKDELATRDVQYMNFYDVALDFILLDAFEDLDEPPSAIVAVIQNRWLSQSFKETALSTAVWSVLKAKRKLLKYPDGFINRFYSISEYLVPVLAWGFLGTDEKLNKSCTYLKNQVVEYLCCLFDSERTRYSNLEELSADIEMHSIKYLQDMVENL